MSLKQFTFEQQQHEIKAAADRERRRIRREQRELIAELRVTALGDVADEWSISLADQVEQCTRAKKGKRT